MASTFLPDVQPTKLDPEKAPHLMVGAASPLWLMFGGAAMAGASWWWWASRWREAVNVEALMALAPEPVAPEPAIEAPVATPEPAPELALAAAPVAMAEAAVEVAAAAVETVVAPITEAVVEQISAEPVETLEAAVAATETIAETAVVAEAEAAATLADDLTRLVGIGPKLSASLAELGVTRFEQIAAWSAEELDSFDALLNLKGRAQRDAWVAQAQRLAKGESV